MASEFHDVGRSDSGDWCLNEMCHDRRDILLGRLLSGCTGGEAFDATCGFGIADVLARGSDDSGIRRDRTSGL